jgi:hypothetical protein
LQCPITGLPDPQIRWTKDGLDLNVKWVLKLQLCLSRHVHVSRSVCVHIHVLSWQYSVSLGISWHFEESVCR